MNIYTINDNCNHPTSSHAVQWTSTRLIIFMKNHELCDKCCISSAVLFNVYWWPDWPFVNFPRNNFPGNLPRSSGKILLARSRGTILICTSIMSLVVIFLQKADRNDQLYSTRQPIWLIGFREKEFIGSKLPSKREGLKGFFPPYSKWKQNCTRSCNYSCRRRHYWILD